MYYRNNFHGITRGYLLLHVFFLFWGNLSCVCTFRETSHVEPFSLRERQRQRERGRERERGEPSQKTKARLISPQLLKKNISLGLFWPAMQAHLSWQRSLTMTFFYIPRLLPLTSFLIAIQIPSHICLPCLPLSKMMENMKLNSRSYPQLLDRILEEPVQLHLNVSLPSENTLAMTIQDYFIQTEQRGLLLTNQNSNDTRSIKGPALHLLFQTLFLQIMCKHDLCHERRTSRSLKEVPDYSRRCLMKKLKT